MTAETAWQRRTRREAARAAYVAEYGNFCELCGNEPRSRGLSEDHDHKTRAHRGWLCYRCNIILRPYVSLEWLRKAVAYFERYLERVGSASAAADEPARKCPNCNGVGKVRDSMRVDPVTCGRCDGRGTIPAADEPGETP